MSIANEIVRIKNNIAESYKVCKKKGAEIPRIQNSANLSTTINSIIGVKEKTLNFFDYDGKLLCSYTEQEAEEMTELPTLPVHNGMICQGWTWTISEIHNALSNSVPLINVGCVFNTDDGATRFYFMIKKNARLVLSGLNIIMAAESSVTIDWGNGMTSVETNDQSYAVTKFLTAPAYDPAVEDGEICVRLVGGCFELGSGNSKNVFAETNEYAPLLKAELGTNCYKLNNYAFNNCVCMKSISFSNTVTSVGANAFTYCYHLEGIVFPNSVISLGQYVLYFCYTLVTALLPRSISNYKSSLFGYCVSLKNFMIPDSVTIIESAVFSRCYSLKSVYIPDSVTYLGGSAFSDCNSLENINIPVGITAVPQQSLSSCCTLNSIYIPGNISTIEFSAFANAKSLTYVDLSDYSDPTDLPTLQQINAFYGCPESMEFVVADQTMLAAFSAATNWSAYSGRFRVKTD